MLRVAQDIQAYHLGFGADSCDWIYSHLQLKLYDWIQAYEPDLLKIKMKDIVTGNFVECPGRVDIQYLPTPVWVETFRRREIPGTTTLYWNAPTHARWNACYDQHTVHHEPTTQKITDRLNKLRQDIYRGFLHWARDETRSLADLMAFDYKIFTDATSIFDRPPPEVPES